MPRLPNGGVCGKVLMLSMVIGCAYGQQAAPPGQAMDIGTAWDNLMTGSGAVATTAPDPVFTPVSAAAKKTDVGDFLDHFFFETRTNYERYQTNFTGNPTFAGVINAPNTGTFNPAGIPAPEAF